MGISFYIPISTPAAIGGIDAYTKLMLHMDGDQSDSQHAITHNGDPQYSTTQGKFGGSSIFLDGSGDFLRAADHDDFDLGGGSWTIDCWIYPQNLVGDFGIFATEDAAVTLVWRNTDNKLHVYMGSDGSWNIASDAAGTKNSWTTSQWYHIAMTWDGSTYKIYVDGVEDYSLSSSTGIKTGNGFNVGKDIGAGVWYYAGYIDEFRISKGIVRWPSDFSGSLPSSAYTSDSYTKLLLHMNGDVSDGAHVVTSNGNPRLDAATTKWDGAVYFGNTGLDYIKMPVSSDWTCPDDFTVDFWIKTADLDSKGIFTSDNWTTNNSFIAYSQSNIFKLYYWTGGGQIIISSTSTLNDNVWHHIAIVRSGSGWALYFDGTSEDTYTNSNDFGLGSLAIGTDYNGAYLAQSGFTIEGYIDEFRWSKGVARWTTDFTPESGPYTE